MTVLTENKKVVEDYMEGFRQSDHARILACLTDDVEWIIPGWVHLHGKEAFDKEIENEAFLGRPQITTTRVVEEDDVVVAEGKVRAERRAGGFLDLLFCDVFVMKGGKIQRLTSYLVELKS